ncbi:MAG: UDP-glucose 4-epimerase GalE [Actinomycetota bacterium]
MAEPSSTVLLTGGCGFIGSHQAVVLLQAGYDVVVVDDLSNARADVVDRIEAIAGRRPRLVELDVRQTDALAAVIADNGVDSIIHFAGLKHVRESMERSIDYFDVNLAGLTSVVQAADRRGVRRMIFSSSGSIYGTAGAAVSGAPLAEDTVPQPTNPYSHSKWICEQVLERVCSVEAGWSVIALRYFNPAGAHPSALLGEDPTHLISNLVPVLMEAAAGTIDAVPIFGTDFDTPDGTALRDYVHVMDVARAHAAALAALDGDAGFEALNIGRGEGVSVRQLIAAAEVAIGRPLAVDEQPRRPGDVPSLVAATDRASKRLDLDDYLSVETILADAWRFRQRRDLTHG